MIPKNSKYQYDVKYQTLAEYQLEKKLWDGTDIRVSQRIGADERMWVRDKLERMHIFGFLDQATCQARDKAAEQAVTREDLNKLISDLPASEDDWKSARKIPVSREFLQQAIEATTPKKRRFTEVFPVLILLGMAAVIMGMAGANSHSATSLVVYSFALMLMGVASIVAGFIIGNLSLGKTP